MSWSCARLFPLSLALFIGHGFSIAFAFPLSSFIGFDDGNLEEEETDRSQSFFVVVVVAVVVVAVFTFFLFDVYRERAPRSIASFRRDRGKSISL